MPLDVRATSLTSTSSSGTGFAGVRVLRRSAAASTRVPAALHDGQLPNHCSAEAPQWFGS